jgi:hypothetical protein
MGEVTVNEDGHMIAPYVFSYGEAMEKREELCIAQC